MSHQVTLKFPDGERMISVEEQESILDAAHRQGVNIIAECELGLCGTCKAVRVEGDIAVDEDEPAGLTMMDLRNNAILCCQSYALSELEISFAYRLETIDNARLFDFTAPVVELAYLADAVVKVVVDASDCPELAFLPGQYANIEVPGSGQDRSYSFSSSPQATGRIEFLIRVLPSGVMSDWLRERAKVGDRLRIKAPYGSFFLRDGDAPLLFVAGGTGVGPFLSMLDAIVASGQIERRIRLLYGVNNRAADLSSLDRLDAFRERLPNFTYDVAVAEPDPDWSGVSGFVTALLREEDLHGGAAEPYLCGPPPMVEAARTWLADKSIADERIHFERFVAS